MAHHLAFPGLAQSTREVYLMHARQFMAHFGRSAEHLGREHVRSWLFWLKRTRRRSPATVNVAIAALCHLFASLDRPEVMAGIRLIREPRPPLAVLTASEVQRLLAAATTVKHRAMLSLLYSAGLRVSELLALKPSDINQKRMCIRIPRNRYPRSHGGIVAAHAGHAARVPAVAPSRRTLAVRRPCAGQSNDTRGVFDNHAQLRASRWNHEEGASAFAAPVVRDASARARDRLANDSSAPWHRASRRAARAVEGQARNSPHRARAMGTPVIRNVSGATAVGTSDPVVRSWTGTSAEASVSECARP